MQPAAMPSVIEPVLANGFEVASRRPSRGCLHGLHMKGIRQSIRGVATASQAVKPAVNPGLPPPPGIVKPPSACQQTRKPIVAKAVATQRAHVLHATTLSELEHDIKVHSMSLPCPVSLRSLVELGLGRTPTLSSIREVLSSCVTTHLVARLPSSALHYSEREKGILRMARFLHHELPVRFARGVDQLDSLPVMQTLPDVREVRSWYADSFQDIRSTQQPESKESEKQFVSVLENVRERHAEELVMMARGIYDLRGRLQDLGQSIRDDIYTYLDKFYLKRIALRILVGHYLALHGEPREDYVGIVCLKSRVRDVVQMAVSDSSWICQRKYGVAPKIQIYGGEHLTFCHVPEHLYYICMELLKNARRAVVERYQGKSEMPPIKVFVGRDYSLSEGEQVIVRIEDQGGGIPKEAFDQIWCYLFTTADPCVQAAMMGTKPPPAGRYGNARRAVPLAGLGYGLPLSRLYARYFGGDLELCNREGQGLDCTVRLSRLGDKREPIV